MVGVAFAVAAAAVAVALGPLSPAESDAGVRAALDSYSEAVRAADGEAGCAVLTRESVRTLEQSAGRPCPEALGAAFERADAGYRRGFRIEVDRVELSGEAAMVRGVLRTSRGEPTDHFVPMRREDGAWRVPLLGEPGEASSGG